MVLPSTTITDLHANFPPNVTPMCSHTSRRASNKPSMKRWQSQKPVVFYQHRFCPYPLLNSFNKKKYLWMSSGGEMTPWQEVWQWVLSTKTQHWEHLTAPVMLSQPSPHLQLSTARPRLHLTSWYSVTSCQLWSEAKILLKSSWKLEIENSWSSAAGSHYVKQYPSQHKRLWTRTILVSFPWSAHSGKGFYSTKEQVVNAHQGDQMMFHSMLWRQCYHHE